MSCGVWSGALGSIALLSSYSIITNNNINAHNHHTHNTISFYIYNIYIYISISTSTTSTTSTSLNHLYNPYLILILSLSYPYPYRYNPTNEDCCDIALEMLSVGPGDVLYDLGCGDARMLVQVSYSSLTFN